jgi:TetR/AcrR family transcriptional regulator, regulator of autoinduction and epiphytic fitness
MDDDVKTRAYDNSRRTDAAQQTRRAVVAAARDIFIDLGYPATTLTAIAERAGVSVQTVYSQFGNKITVLKEVVDYTIAGDDEPTPVADREWVHQILSEPDPRTKLAMHARGVTAIMKRSYRLDWVLRTAAPVDADAAALRHKGARQRRTGMEQLATHLHDRGELRPDVSITEATDRITTLIDPEFYRLTVDERQWTAEQYERWLTELLIASLLPPPRSG